METFLHFRLTQDRATQAYLLQNHILVLDWDKTMCYVAEMAGGACGAGVAQDWGDGSFLIRATVLSKPYDTALNHIQFILHLCGDLLERGIPVKLLFDEGVCVSEETLLRALRGKGYEAQLQDPVRYVADATVIAAVLERLAACKGEIDDLVWKPFSRLDATEREWLRLAAQSAPAYLNPEMGFATPLRDTSICVMTPKGEVGSWVLARREGDSLHVKGAYTVPTFRGDASGLLSWAALASQVRIAGLQAHVRSVVYEVDSFNAYASRLFLALQRLCGSACSRQAVYSIQPTCGHAYFENTDNHGCTNSKEAS